MNEFTALMIFLLTPGILGILVLDALVEHKPWSPFLYTLYAVVFGIAVYLVEQLAVWSSPLLAQLILLQPQPETAQVPYLSVWRNLRGEGAEFNLIEILWALLIALPLAALAALVVNKRYLYRAAQYIGISSKYGEENLFSHFLNGGDVSWVYVRDDKYDLTYQGLVYTSSEAGNVQELVLRKVTVFNSANSQELYKLPYIYLAREHGGFTIEAVPQGRLKETGNG